MKRWFITIGLLVAACGPATPQSSTPAPASGAERPVIPVASAPPPAAPAEPSQPVPAPEAKPAPSCPLQLVAADTITIPMGAAIIQQSPAAKAPRDLEYTVVVTKDRLVAQVFNCPGCRRRMGWGFDVALENVHALDDDNRRALQKALGIAEAPLLGTMDEWAAAKVTGAPSAQPSLPGCATRP